MRNLIVVFMAVLTVAVLGSAGIVNAANSLDAADGSPANALYVNNDGKVGIGTTDPQVPLHIYGIPGVNIPPTGLSQRWDTSYTEPGRRNWGVAREYLVMGDWGLLVSGVGNPTPSISVLHALSNGNVGIGTTNPAAKLDVGGSMIARTQVKVTNAGGSWLLLEDTRAGGTPWRVQTSVATIGDFGLYNENNGTTPFVVLPGGNVGIGTTNPEVALDVIGTIYADDVFVDKLGNGVMVNVKDLAPAVDLSGILGRLAALEDAINDLPPGLRNIDRNNDGK